MNDDYQKLFKALPTLTPKAQLRENILASVKRLHERALFMRKAVFGGGVVLSVVALYSSVSYALGEIAQSSFSQYASLLASDSDVALSNWNEFFYSIAESFPIVGGTLVLACFLLFFVALDRLLPSRHSDALHYSSHRFI